MRRFGYVGYFLGVACAAIFSSIHPVANAQLSLELRAVATGLSNPLFATFAPGDNSRLFIAEQGGNIRILDLNTGIVNPTPFLTQAQMSAGTGFTGGGERGLLGLAFDPNYQTNRRFYVNYTRTGGHTQIRSFQSQAGNPNLADPTSAANILTFDQPFSNHNGGWMGFGPDNFLYIASGDGGSSNDPQNNSLNRGNLLGKMLRISPGTTNAGGYSIPANNPFNDGNPATRPEIWAYGLRNPWRNSFDRLTGDLYIGDVGQNLREEINFQSVNSIGGENYGWRVKEGTLFTGLTGQPGTATPIDPIYEYTRGFGEFQGLSVTGGYVYRGPVAGLQGHYFFADYVSRRLFSFQFDGSDPANFNGTNITNLIDWTLIAQNEFGVNIRGNWASFGEDALGNLYIIDLNGSIYRFHAGAIPEPSAMLLFATGSIWLLVRRRRTEKTSG
ncbi:MAG TPA: PQQ-dependent sugar dehydrogenase [Pirellulaceae bacterium]|nr:PQQ-dependent sugar dehydrogenase [Pirellulaceae bacterium]HMO93413.1 PQQ-dependent sugar dehydrogenase [Pirellulaceae bacterium]HMP70463.1 PQQ-dependent sugar dehydrogenase [Pirellulaceae bacterium]